VCPVSANLRNWNQPAKLGIVKEVMLLFNKIIILLIVTQNEKTHKHKTFKLNILSLK